MASVLGLILACGTYTSYLGTWTLGVYSLQPLHGEDEEQEKLAAQMHAMQREMEADCGMLTIREFLITPSRYTHFGGVGPIYHLWLM